MVETNWSSELDGFPHPIDTLALNSGSHIPNLLTTDNAAMAEYIGVPLAKFQMLRDYPKVLAKWHYSVAAAYWVERRKHVKEA